MEVFDYSSSSVHRRNAIIIGNGFDLNLGLETSYKSFINSEFFETLLNSGNHICQHLFRVKELNNWIDIENELKKIYSDDANTAGVQFIDQNAKQRKMEFIELTNSLCEYIKQIDVDIVNKINKKSFYYAEFKKKYISFSNSFVVCFNYTQTVKIIGFKRSNSDLVMLHGVAKNNTIILGVDEKIKLDKRYDFLYKTSSPYYNCGNTIRELLKIEEIVFMGHSFGETDHYFFNQLFMSSCEKTDSINHRFIIYHYGIEDQRRIISEIRDLIGDNYTMNDFYNNNEVIYIDSSK